MNIGNEDHLFQARLRALSTNWQRATLPELRARCTALAAARALGPLPPAARRAWVQMAAVLEAAAGGRAR